MARIPQPPPQPAPPPGPDNISISKFAGLKNTVEPERLAQDELELAINVDIDDAGQIHRRRGRTKVSSGNFSNLYTCNNGTVIAVKDGNLGIIRKDYSFVTLDGGYPTDPIAYQEVGPTLYFSSRTRAGKIDLGAMEVGPWGHPKDLWLSPVVNPTATLPAIRGRLLGKPPLAKYLGYYNGRIYMATDRVVWATELWMYDYIDKTKNYWYFENDVTMIGVVTDGVYIGTTDGLYFVSGPTFKEMKRVRVGDSPVIPGSLTYAPQELANPGLIDQPVGRRQGTDIKVSILFLTTGGYCGGQDSGVTFNFTEDKFVFPDVESAVSVFRRQDGLNQYLVTGNSGGTPAASARIGDYVDAQLIRGGGRQGPIDAAWLLLNGQPNNSPAIVFGKAAINLSAERVIKSLGDGTLTYADSSTITDVGKVAGITVAAAAAGTDVSYQEEGAINYNGWNWVDGPIYLGLNGQLTQTAPTTGFVQQVGVAISATSLNVSLGTPIVLT